MLDLGFVLENSDALVDTLPTEPSLIQEFGLQIASYNRLTFGLGIDSPFHRYISAFAEYGISLPILVQPWVVGEGASDYSFSSVPHSLTLGLRGFPVDELAIDLGVRIGLSDEPFTGVPATPPWTLLFGVAYTLDPRPKIEVVEKVVEKKVARPAPKAAPQTLFSGTVVDAKTQQPIKGATVTYPSALGLSPQMTDASGRFRGYQLPLGPVNLNASAPGYKPRAAKSTVKKGAMPKLVIKLDADPNSRDGLVEVRVFDPRGRPMAAQVTFSGDAAGVAGQAKKKKPFTSKVKGGRHPIIITAQGYAPLKQMVTVRGGDKTSLRFTLQRPGASKTARRAARPTTATRSAPRRPAPSRAVGGRYVEVSNKRIVVKRPVTFGANSTTLDAQGKAT